MALTVGTGPFGTQPGGEFNFERRGPDRVLYLEPTPRRIRAVVGDTVAAESTRAALLHETGLLPVYYLPRADVREDLLRESDRHTTCPIKGEASYWHLAVGDDVREDAVWAYPEPIASAPAGLDQLVSIRWGAVDEWWEESERIHVHPRDPYHRVDVLPTDRHVVVRVAGAVVADSRDAVVLFETGLPPRFYLPASDVVDEALTPTDTETACPYKGVTSRYYTVAADGQAVEDAVWVYDDPLPAAAGIAGRLAFFNEHVELEVDGRPWERPETVFTRSVRGALAG